MMGKAVIEIQFKGKCIGGEMLCFGISNIEHSIKNFEVQTIPRLCGSISASVALVGV